MKQTIQPSHVRRKSQSAVVFCQMSLTVPGHELQVAWEELCRRHVTVISEAYEQLCLHPGLSRRTSCTQRT